MSGDDIAALRELYESGTPGKWIDAGHGEIVSSKRPEKCGAFEREMSRSLRAAFIRRAQSGSPAFSTFGQCILAVDHFNRNRKSDLALVLRVHALLPELLDAAEKGLAS